MSAIALKQRPARRGMDILFSRRDDWAPPLRDAFRGTRHRIAFDEFNLDNLAACDLVVPLTIADIKLACGAHPRNQALLPLPSLSSVEVCDDKLRFNLALIDAGLGTFVPRISDQPFLPYIVKRRIDECGMHAHIVGSWARERELAGRCDGPDYFRQELVAGHREYATHIVFDEGHIRFSLTIEYLFASEFFVKGQTHCERVVPIADPGCMNVFVQILSVLGFRGLCCVNYKLVGGRPSIFEINPRFGHSLCPYFPRLLEAMSPRWWEPLARPFVRLRSTHA